MTPKLGTGVFTCISKDFLTSADTGATIGVMAAGLLWKLPPSRIGASPITNEEHDGASPSPTEGEHWGLTYNRS